MAREYALPAIGDAILRSPALGTQLQFKHTVFGVSAVSPIIGWVCVAACVPVQLCKAIREGPPNITERLANSPPKPWEAQINVPEGAPDVPTYASCQGKWEQLRDGDLQAAFLAARAAVPGPAPLPRPQMVSIVMSWLEAQEAALAWAVVKYAELVSTSVESAAWDAGQLQVQPSAPAALYARKCFNIWQLGSHDCWQMHSSDVQFHRPYRKAASGSGAEHHGSLLQQRCSRPPQKHLNVCSDPVGTMCACPRSVLRPAQC
jgi:hypothetical protein